MREEKVCMEDFQDYIILQKSTIRMLEDIRQHEGHHLATEWLYKKIQRKWKKIGGMKFRKR